MEREIAVNQIVLPTSYIRNEDGSITYDFEVMAEEFENELSKLDDSVVIMCSVETNSDEDHNPIEINTQKEFNQIINKLR